MDEENSARKFLKEIMSQLVKNIVNKANKHLVCHSQLCRRFKEKTGFEMEEFLDIDGCGVSEDDVMDVIRDVPGLSVSYDKYFIDGSVSLSHSNKLVKNREKILVSCAKLVIDKKEMYDMDKCIDELGNSPLHVLMTLPGIKDDGYLLENLFNTGVNPLAVNKNRETFLHVLFGECHFKSIGHIFFDLAKERKERKNAKLFDEDRKAVLEFVSDNISPDKLASLFEAQDEKGNTVLHDFALSTAIHDKWAYESTTCRKLLEFEGKQSLMIPNREGNVPLHYAFNPSIFRIFVETWKTNCRERNDRLETPVLYILKMSVALAFIQKDEFDELNLEEFVTNINRRNVPTAVKLLQNLQEIITDNEETKETVWIPDVKGNIPIDIILIAIRITSYCRRSSMSDVHVTLAKLLYVILSVASQQNLQRKNNRGQSFFHLLLDTKNDVVKENYIIEAIEILLENHVEIDVKGDGDGYCIKDKIHEFKETSPKLYKKCVESFSLETRELMSCPPRHNDIALRLANEHGPLITVVDKYRYFHQESIGSGAFSNIFVAIKDENVDNISGTIQCRAYALKRIDKASINPKEIKNETTALLSLPGSCENIIKYHDSLNEDRFFQYLVLDLMDGDLREFVCNIQVNSILRKDPSQCVEVTKQIINGVAFLHNNDVIHRDLKPGNILYTSHPHLHFKIADFGLSKDISASSTMMSTLGNAVFLAAGSRCWMAPELVSKKSLKHTKESDIFSLGLVLYYLMSFGEHPFAPPGIDTPVYVIEKNIVDVNLYKQNRLDYEATNFLLALLNVQPSRRTPAAYINQHPFLWSDHKKIEFLKAVGDQPEAEKPLNHPDSKLEKHLQKTQTGHLMPWDLKVPDLFVEMTNAWKQKKYRKNKVIDLVRFIRNAYAHKQERPDDLQEQLDKNIFLVKFPSLVLDVFSVVQQLNLESRNTIEAALKI
ncbi:uncharacterized protein LOC124435860 [Xenia sp. Carnegie-2017]|uniref:uncharacterized protein LOC124435860 n=1 Tax=Xenia sp. Carnegie-2017 TaxID=2897299 RepID=UPI001F04102D|nr:uncharacterized protein LOC124435860 [Xenia sp. Carnegie-2017]